MTQPISAQCGIPDGPCSQLTVLPQWTAVLLAVPASLAVEQIDTLTANIGDRSDDLTMKNRWELSTEDTEAQAHADVRQSLGACPAPGPFKL